MMYLFCVLVIPLTVDQNGFSVPSKRWPVLNCFELSAIPVLDQKQTKGEKECFFS